MTANAIATTANKAISTISETIPSLPKLIELGFTPRILLFFLMAGGAFYITDKAIDSGYFLSGSYDVKQEKFEFRLSPERIEVFNGPQA